jgi:2-methylisocitrate lyase-like PEP mutase family enzyme
MTREAKVQTLRQLHEGPEVLLFPNAWDAGSAKILTALGFKAIATTSGGYAFSTGRQDVASELTREGILENARSIARATHLPVSADLQNGFGDKPEACAETIRLACEAGLAGGSIEDASDDPQKPIYDFALSVERVTTAAEAAQRLGFVLTARAENFLHGRNDPDDTIRRLQAFEKAGADVLYAPALPDIDAIRRVCASVEKPVNVLMGLRGATYSVEELKVAGVRRVSVGGSMARAAFGALVRAAHEMLDQGTFTYAGDAVPSAEMSRYMAGGGK